MSFKCKYFFRFLFLFLFIVPSERLCSQFGNIKVDIYRVELNDSIPIDIRLFNQDSILIYKQNIFDNGIIQIDSVKRGLYNILISKSGERFITLHNIFIRADSVTFLSIDLDGLQSIESKIVKEKGLQVYASSGVPNFAFTIQTYQPGFSPYKEIVNYLYDFGIKLTPLYHPSKYYGIGANLGSNIGFCSLQKDKIKLFSDTFDIEKYFYWKVFVGINNRFVFVQPKDSKSLRPCFLDLGIGYNFPFIYRYVGVNQNYKKINGFISNLNDFSVTARLGFGFLAFTSSYRITDDLKKNYYQVPRLMFGLNFIIPND